MGEIIQTTVKRVAAYKNRKRSQDQPAGPLPADESHKQKEHDEEVDEEEDNSDEREDSSSSSRRDLVQLADAFVREHPGPGNTSTESSPRRLPCPVVIPQRRPKDRARGFMRAYAPVLADVGIDQPTFLDFLDTFGKACRASPWLHTINLASIGTLFLPRRPRLPWGLPSRSRRR
ncbi:hypothetical protein VTN77DRAFT_6649 [Rasamsonia byssochlamydoides]|uniref:uncharacterized protein n=1 Tax=Rasamsonia byssochlamydoides TaxID=89139 RepID=UPI0037444A22